LPRLHLLTFYPNKKIQAEGINHGYLPALGWKEVNDSALKLLLGEDSQVSVNKCFFELPHFDDFHNFVDLLKPIGQASINFFFVDTLK
jgi:hypothetical protein